jgi:hypothetical protein
MLLFSKNTVIPPYTVQPHLHSPGLPFRLTTQVLRTLANPMYYCSEITPRRRPRRHSSQIVPNSLACSSFRFPRWPLRTGTCISGSRVEREISRGSGQVVCGGAELREYGEEAGNELTGCKFEIAGSWEEKTFSHHRSIHPPHRQTVTRRLQLRPMTAPVRLYTSLSRSSSMRGMKGGD